MSTRSKRPPVPRAEAPKATGRLPVDVDVALLQRLAGINCSYEEMAAVTEVSVDTLTRRFADVIEKARDAGRVRLRRAQWSAALGTPPRVDPETQKVIPGSPPNPTMMIWLGKQELGQKDISRWQHEGPDGEPLPAEIHVKMVGVTAPRGRKRKARVG